MKEYVDKSALVAELEKRISDYWSDTENTMGIYPYALKEVIKYIDTLEVKEMNEEPVSEELEEAIEKSFIYHEKHGDDFRSDKQIETAYMYGFETGAKWANKHLIEVKEVDLNKEIKDYFHNQPIITRSKGVDYRLIPSGEEIAKHFFEVGLKVAQKGE